MAYNLTGSIQKELITDVFIPLTRAALVGDKFVTTKALTGVESIKIPGVGAVAIGDYTGGDVAGNNYTDTSVVLTLDKAKYFKEKIENIDSEQSALEVMTPVIDQGSYGIAKAIDQDIFAALATTTQVVTAPALDATNVLDWVGELQVKLDENEAPEMGRALAVTPAIGKLIAQAGVKIGSDSVATEAARSGFIGNYAGFEIYKTNQLANGALGKEVIASAPRSTALGLGFNELTGERVPGQFYSAALGLINYGLKVVKEEFVVKSDATVA